MTVGSSNPLRDMTGAALEVRNTQRALHEQSLRLFSEKESRKTSMGGQSGLGKVVDREHRARR